MGILLVIFLLIILCSGFTKGECNVPDDVITPDPIDGIVDSYNDLLG